MNLLIKNNLFGLIIFFVGFSPLFYYFTSSTMELGTAVAMVYYLSIYFVFYLVSTISLIIYNFKDIYISFNFLKYLLLSFIHLLISIIFVLFLFIFTFPNFLK